MPHPFPDQMIKPYWLGLSIKFFLLHFLFLLFLNFNPASNFGKYWSIQSTLLICAKFLWPSTFRRSQCGPCCDLDPVTLKDSVRGMVVNKYILFFPGGPGRVIGTDSSSASTDKASKLLKDDLQYGTVELVLSSPENFTFIPNMFDIVFTVNGFYFWNDMDATLREIYRVLRPNCLFLTCVFKLISTKQKYLEIPNNNCTTEMYVYMLKEHGFVRVNTVEHCNAKSGLKYQIVRAYTRKRK